MAKKKKPTKAPKVKSAKAAKPAKVAKKAAPAKKAAAAPKKAAPAKKAAAPAKKAAPPAPTKKAEVKAKVGKSVKEEPKKAAKTAVPAKAVEAKGKPEKVPAVKEGKKAKGKPVDEAPDQPVVAERPAEREMFLTDAEGRRLCKVKDCDQLSAVELYCRYHYLLFWKKIQNRKKILSEGKLEQYIEELTSRYPIKFLELIRKDLHTEADFMSAIQELDIDESSTMDEFEEDENFIDEVRGISAEAVDRGDEEF